MLSPYKLIFFDIDNTLLDHKTAEKKSFLKTLDFYQIKGDQEEIFLTYKKENSFLWKQYENGKISPADLQRKRWQIIMDKFRTDHLHVKEISSFYSQTMVEEIKPLPYALDLCSFLQEKTKLVALTNGFFEVQNKKLKNNNLHSFFSHVVTSEVAGAAKPHEKIFSHAHGFYPKIRKEEIIMVGDNLNADIRGANNYGIDSCHFDFNLEKDSPLKKEHPSSYTVNCLSELI